MYHKKKLFQERGSLYVFKVAAKNAVGHGEFASKEIKIPDGGRLNTITTKSYKIKIFSSHRVSSELHRGQLFFFFSDPHLGASSQET